MEASMTALESEFGTVRIPSPSARGGLLGWVTPNSRVHWSLLALGVAGSLLFNLTYLIAGWLRPGYDWVRQPMSALSLGPGGAVQVTNFAVFGAVGLVTAFAWRPTLGPGLGATWYPRLRVAAALTLICAGVFSQDPGDGYPVGAAAPAQPSTHAIVHNLVSFVSLTLTVAELLILARRFAREPQWRGWATLAIVAGVLMMGFLATFGTLAGIDRSGGIFEKLASFTPTVFGIALAIRLFARRDARITSAMTAPQT
jgi:heme A synthase